MFAIKVALVAAGAVRGALGLHHSVLPPASRALSSHGYRAHTTKTMAQGESREEYYRKDGVRITHDPYAPGMAEKYGLPGATDAEGFDPYADTVGPGIYGGNVKRDDKGEVVIGRQYQNHNKHPGPVYAGGGYTLMSKAIQAGPETVRQVLADFPELANEVTTGGASPLHMCGMSQRGQDSTQVLIDAGADINKKDTYGFTPLHRMASNNLPRGAEALLRAGADPTEPTGAPYAGETPTDIARASRARAVLAVLQSFGA
ncbi:unnamed protein product [Pedinophyceae sp. YPF-701]|nr:unnamed protein product [Pedinophyceae sp. YPF-701]